MEPIPENTAPAAHRSWARRWWPALAAVGVAVVALGVMLLLPPGARDPHAAAMAQAGEVAADDSARVLIDRRWGDGMLVLVGFQDPQERRHLGLVFTLDRGRGWVTIGWTHEQAAPEDVVVGSLHVAGLEAVAGQPPWSAAYGELSDDRIRRVVVEWADEERTVAEQAAGAYLVVREGEHTPAFVHYLGSDDEEIATVPV